MRLRLFPLLLLAILLPFSAVYAGDGACRDDREPESARRRKTFEGCAWCADRIATDAAAAAGTTKEAFLAAGLKARARVADDARATARAQGLDAASADRYVATRVAAFDAAELRRLLQNAAPEVRAAMKADGPTRAELPTQWLVVFSALTVVAGAARRLRREPA